MPGRGKRILVVQRRVVDSDQDLTLGELLHRPVGYRPNEVAVRCLPNYHRLEALVIHEVHPTVNKKGSVIDLSISIRFRV